jgi:hypothetical protein
MMYQLLRRFHDARASVPRAVTLAAVVLTLGAIAASPGCSAPLSPAFDVKDTSISKDAKEYGFLAQAFLEDSTATLPFGDAPTLQSFLARTPYDGRSSFLARYSSNGVSAAEAIVRAGERYRINNIVVLALVQSLKGFVSSAGYPSPPSAVEFAFQCGCNGKSTCDPRFAGFDKQVDCLVAGFRGRLDDATAGATDGGWGIRNEGRTMDGIRFTPSTNATAAFYDLYPVVGTGDRGASMFWNILVNYARYVQMPLTRTTPTAGP